MIVIWGYSSFGNFLDKILGIDGWQILFHLLLMLVMRSALSLCYLLYTLNNVFDKCRLLHNLFNLVSRVNSIDDVLYFWADLFKAFHVVIKHSKYLFNGI